MAKNKALDIRRYTFRPTDTFLVDANIWLYINGPSSPADWRAATYSKAFAAMIAAQSQLHIDVLILSEFINRYARLDYDLLYPATKPRPSFKNYRQSSDFKPTAQAIAIAARRILKFCARLENGFSTLDIVALLDEFEQGNADFNDQVLIDLCQRHNLTLITHDGDFRNRGVSVVTANRYLLN